MGFLSVQSDGRNLELGPPRQRAVFALLLAKAGGVVSVDSIVSQIWGASPPPTAHATLQSYVSRLRRLLADCTLPDGSTPGLLYQPPGYALVLDPRHVDVHRFEQAVAEGRRLVREAALGEAHAALSAALESWAGTPYEELSAYDFAVQEAARLEQLRLGAIESGAHCALRLGHEEDILHALELEAKCHPLRERLIALLMHTQYRSGRQADALRTYDITRRALAEELGTDPGKELVALHTAILRQDSALDRMHDEPSPQTAPAAPDGSAPSVGPSGATLRVTIPRPGAKTPAGRSEAGSRQRSSPAAQPVLAGRDEELRSLLQSASDSFHTSGRVALVVGEAGSGKTRLLSELAHAAPDSTHTLWASCSESEDTPDYWPWTTLLRQICALWPERMHRLPGWIRHSLAALVPELCCDTRDAHGHASEDCPASRPLSKGARFTLHDAVCQALVRTVREPTVIMLEGLDRADAPSLALLRLFVEHLRSVPVLLVVTTRTFRLAYDAELRRAAAVILQSTDARRIRLDGLGLAATGELAAGILGGPPDPRLLHRLHHRTSGNPYFLVYLLRSLKHGLDRCLTTVIPHELADVILQRLSTVPAGVRRVIDFCAVMEDSCERRVVEAMMRREGVPLEHVLVALHGGLLQTDPCDAERLRFVHPLVKEAVRRALDNSCPAGPAEAETLAVG